MTFYSDYIYLRIKNDKLVNLSNKKIEDICTHF